MLVYQRVTIGIPMKHCKELGCHGILPIYKMGMAQKTDSHWCSQAI